MTAAAFAAGALAAGALAACSFDGRGVPTTAGATDAPIAPDIDAPAITATDAAVDATLDADLCPAGYVTIPGAPSRYRVGTIIRNWLDAEKDCEHDGFAHLAILDSDSERDAVRGAVQGERWLGVTDIVKEDEFLKVTGGAATYLPWLGGEPNNQFNEDCVELKAGGFNDEGCGALQGYVCECDGLPSIEGTYTVE